MNRIRKFILRVAVILLLPAPAAAQYMYLDTDGDGAHTAADVLQPTGSTTIDVWLRTDSSRDGGPATCDTDDGPLSMSGYEFILHASNGTVTWGTLTNRIAGFTGVAPASDDVDLHAAANGGTLAPGSYRLATIQVAPNSGTPGITIASRTPLGPSFVTAFVSQCSGLDFTNALTLGTDWFDADGIPYGGAANRAPTLDPVPDLVVLEAETLEQPLGAQDEDGGPLQFTKRSGPAFLIVSTLEPGTGLATGLARLTPGFADSGTTSATVEVSDGLGSDLVTFRITVEDQDRAPVLEQPEDMTAFAGRTTSQDLHASDPDGGVLEFSMASGPTFARVVTVNPFTPALGRIDVTPVDADDDGDTSATVAVSDGTLSAERTVVIHVIGAAIFEPQLCRPYDMTVLAGSEGEQVLMVSNLTQSASLTFSLVSGPAFAQVTTVSSNEPHTGLLHVTPSLSDLGEHTLAVAVTDGHATSEGLLRVTVVDRPVAPEPLPERFTSTFRGFEVGSLPQAVVATDLNQDGIPDLVVPEQACGVSVMLGVGRGGFGTRVDYHLEGEPKGAAAADLDQDGHIDVVVAGGIGDQLFVLRGDGTGALHPFSELRAGSNVAHVAAGDLNRDGIPDLVAAIENENAILVYAGLGGAAFAFPHRYDAGIRPCFTIIQDLNRDGIPDLCEASEGSNVASVYLGRGDGTFTPQTQYSVALGPTAVDAGDFDDDGNVDLVTPGFHSNIVSVLYGDGSGAFPRRADFQSGLGPWSVCVADVNGDSRADLVTANTADHTVSILLGRAGGTFEDQREFSAGYVPRSVTCADLSGDHVVDLAVTDESAAFVAILTGNGDGTFGTASSLDAVLTAWSIAIADLNGDGRADLGVAYSQDRALGYFRGLDAGAFDPPVHLEPGGQPASVVTADMTGDGAPDLVASLRDVGAIALYRGGASFGVEPPALVPVGAGPLGVTIGDWNRDGLPDIAVACHGARVVTVQYGAGAGNFSGRIDIPVVEEPVGIVSGDWNGDGFPDLAATVGYGVAILWGGATGFTAGPTITPGGQGVTLAAGDLDQDGKPELVVCDEGGSGFLAFPQGRIHVLYWSGTDPSPVEAVYPGGRGNPAIADVTNDGRADVVLQDNGLIGVLPGRGDRTLAPLEAYGAGVIPVSFGLGDVTGDGRPDVVTSDFERTLTILRNLGSGSTPPLVARAFTQPDDRVIRLPAAKPEVCIQLEPVGGAFSIPDVDPATLRLGRKESSARPIGAILGKSVRVADTDRNGISELSACFAKADLRQLFSDVHGMATVEATLTGQLQDGRHLEAAIELTLVGAPGGRRLAAHVFPNPMNPTATLTFTTAHDGPVRVTIFNVQGRAVARVFESKSAPAGDHDVALGGRAGRAADLATGIYFYRVETPEEAVSGRFAVLK